MQKGELNCESMRGRGVGGGREVCRVLLKELRTSARRLDAVLAENQGRLARREAAGLNRSKRFVEREVLRFRRYLGSHKAPAMGNDHPETVEDLLVTEGFVHNDSEAAFAALRRIGDRLELLEDQTFLPSKPDAVKLDIGNIFRHRKWGFRGVIVQWFSACPATQDWISQWGPFERGASQPFYRTLVDAKDREQPFMSLAAEENLDFLEFETKEVEHPKVDDFFSHFEFGHHVLNESIQKAFPEDW